MEEITYGGNSCYGVVKLSLGKARKAQNLSFTKEGGGRGVKQNVLWLLLAAFDKMCKKEMTSEFINLQAEMKGGRVHKFEYLLDRMRPLLNYKKIKMRNSLIQRIKETH